MATKATKFQSSLDPGVTSYPAHLDVPVLLEGEDPAAYEQMLAGVLR